MFEQESIALIGSVGFPAVMCLWFMWRIEPLVKTNNEVLAAVAEPLPKKKKKN